MTYRTLVSISGGLATACGLVSAGAIAVDRTPAAAQTAPAAQSTAAPIRGSHYVQTGRGLIFVKSPPGCSAAGTGAFVGGGYSNVAGGYAAGVLAGSGNKSCDEQSAVAGGSSNIIGGNGGSPVAGIVAGYVNTINDSFGAVIGGGLNNAIAAVSVYGNTNLSAIGGGDSDVIESPDSFIGSGQNNVIVPPAVKLADGNSPSGFIGAGYGNSITADFAVVAGGFQNTLTGEYAAITGGYDNTASGGYTATGGGYGNINSGTVSTIAGGYLNTASGRNAAIPGGAYNTAAGAGAFAAGYRADAAAQGTFVWNDDDGSSLAATAANQFLARASGGFSLFSSAGTGSGVTLAPGSGAWSTLSDRHVKTAVADVDDARILAKIAAMPVTEWSYRAQGSGIRHLGPMAQDFRAAFGLGEDDRHISTVDEEGVALAAIKALQAQAAAKDRRIASLERRLAAIEARLDGSETPVMRSKSDSGR